MIFELKENETILEDVAANLYRGIEGVGGRMKITDRRVIFEPHAFNLQTQAAEIPLEQISEIRKYNNLGFIPNGILFKLKSGIQYKFVVWGREHLITLIKNHTHSVR
jgi:hypothetical protein